MEARTNSLRRAATPRRRPGTGTQDRWKPAWPLAARQQLRACHGSAKSLLRLARPAFPRSPSHRIIHRTAVYVTRTYGGVGGAESRDSPLSRCVPSMNDSLEVEVLYPA